MSMRNIVITYIFAVITLLRCTDTSVPCTSKNAHNTSKYKHNFGGYDKIECIRGNKYVDHYAKVVFHDIYEKNGDLRYFVTHYAYSIEIRGCRKYYWKGRYIVKRLNLILKVYYKKDSSNIAKCLERFKNEPTDTKYPFKYVAAVLKKDQYIQWIKDHPDTVILPY